MKKLLTILLLIVSVCSYGQSSNWLWGRGATGTGIGQEGTGMATDANGNVIIIGGYADTLMSLGNDTIFNSQLSTEDSYIAKFSPFGSVLWIKSIGGVRSEIAYSVCADNNGNIYVTGSSNSPTIIFGNISLPGSSISDNMFIAKYDSDGNEVWARNENGVHYSLGSGICADANGNIFVAGCYVDTVTFGTTTLISAGQQDAFLIKYDADGNLIWAKSEGGVGSDGSIAVSVDGLGNIITLGNFSGSSISFGSFTLTNSGSNDIYIVKHDTSGVVVWAKSGNGSNDDYAQQVSADYNGNIYIVGSFNSSSLLFNTTTLNSAGGLDVFIVKYNSSGNVLWAKSAGGTNDDYGFSVSADGGGNVYFTGGFGSSITFDSVSVTAPAFAAQPMFIIKFDSIGHILCADALSCGGDDMIAVSADNFGNAFISGDYSANPIFIIGSDTLTSYGLAFIAKYNCSTSVGVNELQPQENISIYPNPFSTQLTFSLADNDQTTVSLYNFLGQRVLQQTFTNSTTINTAQLADGIYFYELRDDKGTLKTGKLVKQ